MPGYLACRYEVAKKKMSTEKCVQDMAVFIRDISKGCSRGVLSGIVYCLSRNDCEIVATSLQVDLNKEKLLIAALQSMQSNGHRNLLSTRQRVIHNDAFLIRLLCVSI